MASKSELSTSQIEKIADELSQANKDLKKELKNTASIMKELKRSWDSPAYRESNNAFSKFESEYSVNYEKIINQYVSFLRDNVSKGYKQTESENQNLASQYK